MHSDTYTRIDKWCRAANENQPDKQARTHTYTYTTDSRCEVNQN